MIHPLVQGIISAGGGATPPPPSGYTLPAFSPLAACAYPLDDNGTIAGAFGYAAANVIGAALQRIDHTIVGAGVTGATAIAIAADPFASDAITRSGRQWVGIRPVSITAALLANAEAATWPGIGPGLVWASGGAVTTINVRPDPAGGTYLFFGGLGEGAASGNRIVDIPFDEISVGIYSDHTAQKIGYTINGIDQGYIDGPAITTGTAVTPYCFVSNGALPDLDGENIVFDFLTVPDEYTFAKGLTSICAQAIPNVLDYFGSTPVNPLELTGAFAPHLAFGAQAANVFSASDPAPPSCAMTLAAPGIASLFGASALDVSGQTASITLPASPAAQYAASQDESVTINWTGKRRVLQFKNAAAGSWTWVARGLVNDPPSVDAVWRWNPGANNWTTVVGGVVQNTYPGAAADTTALVVHGDGNVEFWLRGVHRETVAAFAAAESIRPLTLTSGGAEGDTMSSEFGTSDYDQTYGGADDWCGNAIALTNSAQFSVTDATLDIGVEFIATEPVMRVIDWAAAEERSLYLKNPGTWSYQSLAGPLFTKTTPILHVRSEDGKTNVRLYASGNGASPEDAVPKWILSASRIDSPTEFLSVSVNDGAWTANELSTDNPVLTIDGDGFLHVYLDGSTEMTLAYATELGSGQPAEPLFAPGSKILVGGTVSMTVTDSGATVAQPGVSVSAEIGTDGGSLAPGLGQYDWYGNAL